MPYKSFSTQKQKPRFIWNKLYSNKQNLLIHQLRIQNFEDELRQAENDLNTIKSFIDFSSDWETVSYDEETFTWSASHTYQITFNKLNINHIPFIRTAFIYAFGNPDDNIFAPTPYLVDTFVQNGDYNEVVQIIDLELEPDSEIFKKVVINKSLTLGVFNSNSATPSDMKVKFVAYFYHPHEFI